MRFLIVEDHPIMRVGERQLIERAWPDAVIDEASTLAEALAHVADQAPTAIVMDLALPDASGTDGISAMLHAAPASPILVLSFNAESAYAARLLQMGAAGYLPKDRAGDELVEALQRLVQGRRYVTASMADHLVDLLGGRANQALPHQSLSEQEYRVMLSIAAGRPPAQTAEVMGVSVKTVGTYRTRLFTKMRIKSNVELAKYCLQHGLTE
ncbi:response regulator transcription factor [Rhizobacter sp. Root1221]|uniref:response regulator n=1 Tax=Rhizobacter sp. Root1221 TaxID=1736433 RepID=UPI0006F2EA93|nr:response regulator transcription factor [Rhizobacter sp. Root1221]KQV95778.1 LuxR family transcriptional regulator [Rhizobacter sp. Root1221]